MFVVAATGCAVPNRPPLIVQAARPEIPPLAEQQRIAGTVVVRATVDAKGLVDTLTVMKSPSTLLNASAVRAVRATTFAPQLSDCMPVPSTVTANVRFAYDAPSTVALSVLGCTTPNAYPTTLAAALPVMPPLAIEQHIYGVVAVKITLDEASTVVNASILHSPSAILNQAALAAARNSRFRTRTVNCEPVGGDFQFNVEFAPPPTPAPTATP